MTTRVLSVDPGESRLGLAVSDPSRTIARPLKVIPHVSRVHDAQGIVEIAEHEGVDTIVVGVAYDSRGEIGPQARRAFRLVGAIRQAGFPRVETWDETGSTEEALQLHAGDEMTDARAAAVILQGYLDAGKTT
ncbi:MAG TPA: RuvX/YqgF family protein [Anaerolineales bacterium]|nr:RuvX/YqgF family protein [Anaerolineales bacterium]